MPVKKFKLPVMLPPGVSATLTQGFGATDNPIEPFGPNGEPHFHYGIDLTFGDPMHTFGTPIVSPFSAGTMDAYLLPPGDLHSTPFVELFGTGASGNHYKLILGHVSQIIFHAPIAEGGIVALAGNYGMVSPQPTPAQPFAGSHLHLGLQVNGVWKNPVDYFDLTSSYVGAAHDPASDIPRFVWALQQLQAQLANLQATH